MEISVSKRTCIILQDSNSIYLVYVPLFKMNVSILYLSFLLQLQIPNSVSYSQIQCYKLKTISEDCLQKTSVLIIFFCFHCKYLQSGVSIEFI